MRKTLGEIMPSFSYPFTLPEDEEYQINGILELEEPLPYRYNAEGSGFYRPGKIVLEEGGKLDIVLYHNDATARFMYLHSSGIDLRLLRLAGISDEETAGLTNIVLPGQLCMGADRTNLIGQANQYLFASPVLESALTGRRQQELAVFPIAREGLKYQVTEAIFANYGMYCDEILLDAHHVFSSAVPIYQRAVELTLFKDKDLDKQQKEHIRVAFIADSIASGLVMKEVIARVRERFDHLERVEVIAPLATIRGLSRIGQSELNQGLQVRVHVFETLLNALPPDYYYSAHFDIPELHIQPELEKVYRDWWGKDASGRFIADTACAGYGWSEVFYSPRKQIQMMNSELVSRHSLTIAEIIRRNIQRDSRL
jgi:hypothetical protein